MTLFLLKEPLLCDKMTHWRIFDIKNIFIGFNLLIYTICTTFAPNLQNVEKFGCLQPL